MLILRSHSLHKTTQLGQIKSTHNEKLRNCRWKRECLFLTNSYSTLFQIAYCNILSDRERIERFIEAQESFLAVVWFGSTPFPVSNLDRRHTGRLRKRDNLMTGEGASVEPNYTTAGNLALYKSFSTLWSDPSLPCGGGGKVEMCSVRLRVVQSSK